MNDRTKASMRAALSIGAVTGLVTGCGSFGPDRNPPHMVLPEHYTSETHSIARVVQAPPIPAWWTLYQSAALNALIQEGLDGSPSLSAARSTLQAAREQLRGQVGSNVLPTVDLDASPTRQRSLGIPILPQETFLENIFTAQAEAKYTFDFFGAAVLADRALRLQVQQQAYQLEATRRALAANIVLATINAASLQEQIEATQRVVDLGEQRAAKLAARYAQGSASRDEVLAAEEDAANTAATLPALRAQAMSVRHAQAVLLGRTPDRAPTPMPLDALHVPDSVPVSVPTELLHQRPDILAAEAAVRASADEAGAAEAALFPSLTLSASYGRGGFDWSTFDSPAGAIWSVGANLTQPIFHGGALKARQRQYQDTYEATVALYKQTVIAAFQNVADSLVALDEDANTLRQAERAAEAAAGVQSDTVSRYRLGATPFYATLTAGQQYQNAQIQLIRARAARLADTANLLDAMGDPAPRR